MKFNEWLLNNAEYIAADYNEYRLDYNHDDLTLMSFVDFAREVYRNEFN